MEASLGRMAIELAHTMLKMSFWIPNMQRFAAEDFLVDDYPDL